MDKAEREIQKALGTIKRAAYKVSFTYRRLYKLSLYKLSFHYYEKHVFAYDIDEAIQKVLVKFSKDPMTGVGAYREGKGIVVSMFDKEISKRGRWVVVRSVNK